MITQLDILKAITTELKKIKNIPVFLDDIKEGFGDEAFFLKAIGKRTQINKYLNNNTVNIYITYVKAKNTITAAELYSLKDLIVDTFYTGLFVKTETETRHINFNAITAEVLGQDGDILEIRLPAFYMDAIKNNDDNLDKMSYLQTKYIYK